MPIRRWHLVIVDRAAKGGVWGKRRRRRVIVPAGATAHLPHQAKRTS